MGQKVSSSQTATSTYGAINESADDEHQAPRPSSSNADSQYEELMKNSMTCPTCKGLGRVSRDHEDELVAIIPLSDQRLKPRRTWLIIFVTILICALVAGLVLFFIIPRSIAVDSLMVDRVIEPNNVTLEEFPQIFSDLKYRLNISFTEPVSLRNDNFFPVDVVRIQIEVNHAAQQRDGSLILTLMLNYDNSTLGGLQVPLRSSEKISSDLAITLDSRLDTNKEGFNTYLIRLCMENPSVWSYITVVLNTTIYYDYLGNTQHQTLSYDRHIGCYPYDDSMSTFPVETTTTTEPTFIAKKSAALVKEAAPHPLVFDKSLVDRVIQPKRVSLEKFNDSNSRLNISFVESFSLRNENSFPVDVKSLQIEGSYVARSYNGSSYITPLIKYNNASLGSFKIDAYSSKLSVNNLAISLDSRERAGSGLNSYLIRLCTDYPSVWSYFQIVMKTTIQYEAGVELLNQTSTYDHTIGCSPQDDNNPTQVFPDFASHSLDKSIELPVQQERNR